DSGTTVCALAEAFRAQPIRPLTVVTSNLPVGEMLAAIEGVEVFQIAGQLLHLQSTLLGEAAARSIEFWSFDIAFLSAEGMDADGLWNSQAAIVAQQRVVLQRSRRHVFCIDSSKVNRKAPHFLLSWGELDLLLTDAPHEKLARLGIKLGDEHYVSASGSSASARRGPGDAGSRVETRGGDEMPVHIL
ncbi:MAG TPA: hypothetical protein VEO95_13145, partial [Chthoniobacteraceae bacterium]|nr:hypothetical protein [Chthoniobacteraceae bacterium]